MRKRKYTNLEYKEANISQRYFQGRTWNQLNKKERAKFAGLISGTY